MPLTEAIRATPNEALRDTLHDPIAREHAAHREHWNAVGPAFVRPHDLQGELYGAIGPHVDVVAGRRLALGVRADGRRASAATGAVTRAPAPGPGDLETSLTYPRDRCEAVQGAHRGRIEATAADAVTQDLLIGAAGPTGAQGWRTGAHLSTDGTPGGAADGGN